MLPDKLDNNKPPETVNHEMKSLFSEWPAPSDVVSGFGGNPEKAAQTQWKIKKDPPKSIWH